MIKVHRTCLKQFRRFAETIATPTLKLLAEPLTKRTLIRVQGVEVVPFLQGLITNDMKHLQADGSSSMFTMFLNNAGRVLYDAIIYRTPNADTFLIECDGEGSEQLRKHLRLYRVKKKIDIDSVDSELATWVVYNPIEGGQQPKSNEAEMKIKSSEILISADPRVKELGVRIIQPRSNEVKDIVKLFSNATLEQPSLSSYSAHRYIYGVGEGLRDHPPGKCFPLEANCDFLHGVSFHKGCYIGQELTARVHHTGVVRKRLMPLKLSADPKDGATSVQTQAGATVGTLRAACQRRALALLRVEQVLKAPELMIDGDPCKVFKPYWWPGELPNRLQMRKD